MEQKEIYIETERIIIRNFKQKDAEGLLEYLSNPRVNALPETAFVPKRRHGHIAVFPERQLRYAVSLKKMTLLSVTCLLCVRMRTL